MTSDCDMTEREGGREVDGTKFMLITYCLVCLKKTTTRKERKKFPLLQYVGICSRDCQGARDIDMERERERERAREIVKEKDTEIAVKERDHGYVSRIPMRPTESSGAVVPAK